MRRTAAAAAHTREVVLEAALFCFAEDGWGGATLEGIAQRVGMTRGAVCHHFRDKHSLLLATLREGWAHQSELLLAPLMDEDVPPARRLVDFIAGYLDRLRADPSLRALAVVTTLVARQAPGLAEGVDEHRLGMDVWRERLARVLGSCTLRPDVTTDQVLFSLLALVSGATLEAAVDPAHLPDEGGAGVIAMATVRGWIDG